MWEGHPRTTTPTWRKTRTRLLKPPAICHICGQPGANELDHISPWTEETRAGRNPDRPENLAPIHDDPCHRTKTAQEANHARWQRNPRRRPAEPHPGLR